MNLQERLKNQKFEYTLLAPGPVNIHPRVQEALALPMIHHRTPQFDLILKNVLTKIKSAFGTQEPVYLLSTTGSGGMEALLVNVLSPGDRVLAIVSGKFGERWAEMAQVFGAQVDILSIPWGQAADPLQIEEALKKNPTTRAVLCQACETSTGVKHPIEQIAKMTQNLPETLLLVDGITAVGAYPLPMDNWGLDGLVAGSQKAFMLPTGMSFVSFSKKAQKFFDRARMTRYYLDIRKEQKANLNGETYFSSSVALVRALDIVLDLISMQTWNDFYSEISTRAQLTRDLAQLLGFELYAQSPSESLTALTVPAGLDGQKLRTLLETKYKTTVMGGQDQAKGKILRIGHMGYIPSSHLIQLFSALEQSLTDLGLTRSESERIEFYQTLDKEIPRKLNKYSKFWQ